MGLSPARQRYNRQKDETFWVKYLAIPGLALVFCLSITLLILNKKNWSRPLEFITGHSSLVGLVVQVVSYLLGSIYIYVLCTTITLSGRTFFEKNSLSLDRIKLFNALASQQLDTSLPWDSLFILTAFLIVSLLPSALWAGAITPVVASRNTTSSIQLPGYRNNSWLFAPSDQSIPPTHDEALGIFTFNPSWDIQGLLLNSASGASSRTGGNVTHPKLDKTQYTYVNRSYGVGASVGLTDKQLAPHVLKYTYFESGFDTNVSCIYNETSAFGLKPSADQPSNWLLHAYEAIGQLPNSKPGVYVDYVAATMLANPAIVALGVDTDNGLNYVAITTNGPQYSMLNNSQCLVSFTQKNFQVDVDVLNRTITVSPVEETTWLPNKMVTDRYNQKTVSSLYNISTALSTALYVNPLGDALVNNIDNVQANQGVSVASNLTGIEAVFTSIMDDVMVAYGSAQIMLINDTIPTAVTVISPTYGFGTAPYIYAVLSITILTSLVYIAEVFRTRGWLHLSKFDFLDLKGVIIAASQGGKAIADEAHALHEARGTSWYADDQDRLVGRIHVKLELKEEDQEVAIVLSKRQPQRGTYTSLLGKRASSEGNIPLREMEQEQPLVDEAHERQIL